MNPREGAYILAAGATCGFEETLRCPCLFPDFSLGGGGTGLAPAREADMAGREIAADTIAHSSAGGPDHEQL